MLRRATGLVVVTWVSALGCTSQADRPVDDAANPVRVVGQYVQALRRGDIDTAIGLRCSSFGVDAAGRAQFTRQLLDLQDRIGRLEGVKAGIIAPTGVRPADDLLREVEVSYRVIAGGKEWRPLVTVTGLEGQLAGPRRICGVSTPDAGTLRREMLAALSIDRPTRRTPFDLLAVRVPDGSKLFDSKALPPSTGFPGELWGWTRGWRTLHDLSVRVSARPFKTTADAQSYAEAVVDTTMAANGVDRIFLRRLPKVLGARVLAYHWLGIQPPDAPPYADYLLAVYGSMVVTVEVEGIIGGGSDEATEVMERIDDRA